MALDIDKLNKKFDEIQAHWETEEGKKELAEYFNKFNRKEKIRQSQIERLKIFVDRFGINQTMEKLMAKYHSEEYRSKEYSKGYEPREPLLWLMFRYAKKYCKPCKNKKYFNMFTGSAYYVGDYVLQVMRGQGSVLQIDKKK